jgi:excinuclease ABC subunit B
MVAILDADKEGYLRSDSSLIQTIGRAARHSSGHIIMYADNITRSMRKAIDETYRRRDLQEEYNREHDITPQGIRKAVRDITDRVKAVAERRPTYQVRQDMPREDLLRVIKDLETQMKLAARALEFEKAALIRDEVMELRKVMASGKDQDAEQKPASRSPARSGSRRR